MAVYTYQWAESVRLKAHSLEAGDSLAYCILNFVLPTAFTCVSW